jgi:hypothetical protein
MNPRRTLATLLSMVLGVAVLATVAWLLATRGGTTTLQPDSSTALPAGAPSPSLAPITLRYHGTTFSVSTAADCAPLENLGADDYYQQFCQALDVHDWRNITLPTAHCAVYGPSPQMMAIVTRFFLLRDTTACTDTRILKFVELGSNVDASTATQRCIHSIDVFWSDGGTTIEDVTNANETDPLWVYAK